MICFPFAKINIGLFVTEKRIDGFHNLESVFYPLPQCKDVLEIMPSLNELIFNFSGLPIEGNFESNLITKAYNLLYIFFPDKIKPLHIYLHKAIPMGAGMGGGSSDGAFMLKLLNDFFQLNLSTLTLLEFAQHLGSDCPFFIKATPQLAKGRGEILTPINLDLSPYEIKINSPNLHVNTKLAFESITPKAATFNLETLETLPLSDWKYWVKNDFEEPLFKQYPNLKIIKEKMYAEGAIYASMTGTGSSIYGIFKKKQ